jgi:type II secretory pathway pseudopilin PulG
MFKVKTLKRKNMKKTQKGFTHVEALLLIVIVGIIVAVGWYVWHSVSNANKSLNSADNTKLSVSTKKKTSSQSPANSTSSSSNKVAAVTPPSIPAPIVSSNPAYVTTTPTVVNNYVTINEWKVKFKHSGTITIMYAHDSHDKNSRAAFFSSTQLAAKNKACKAEFYPAGYIVRYKGAEHVYNDEGTDSGKSAEQYAADLTKSSVTFAHVGEYYYFYHGPKGKCADIVGDLQDQTAAVIQSMLQNLVAAE